LDSIQKKQRVKVGIVGSQFAAELHAKAYARCAHAEVVAAAAIDNLDPFCDKYGIPGRYADYRDMLNQADIDLVSVCVPNFLHHEVVMAAAAAGKHVVCEKPLATNLADGAEMVQTCRERRVKLMYAEDWLFAPAIRRAKAIIDEGAIGDILFIKAKETHLGSHSPFAKKVATCGGGSMIHLAIHPAAFVRWLAGSEVRDVMGKVTEGLDKNLVHRDFEGEDWGAGILTLENGVRALIEGNYITLGGMDDRIEIYGTRGNIHIELTMGSPITVYSQVGYSYVLEKADMSTGWTRPAVDEEASLGYEDEIAAFVQCVMDGTPPPAGASGEDGLAALAVIEALYTSSREGRAVDPQELVKELL
jgi:predicted dehydrogenase